MTRQMVANAETCLIGCLILDFKKTEEARRKLTPEDFTVKEYAAIFKIMLDHEEEITDDFTAFWNRLPQEYQSIAVSVMDTVPSLANYTAHIQTILHNSQNRRIKTALSTILINGGNLLQDINALAERENEAHITDDFTKAIETAHTQFAEDLYDNSQRLYTGFSKLDSVIGGLRMGTISYIGARPSTGKTTFALNIIRQQMKTGNKVLLFSLEMNSTQILERITSDVAGIDYGKINTKQLTGDEKQTLVKAAQQLCGDRLYINDSTYTIEAMDRIIYDYKPQMVVIDFIQFVRTIQKFAARRNEIDYISGELKRIARQQKCHIMVLSQLSRDGSDMPSMRSLKESGALEQDGDYILLLHRPYVLDKNEREHTPEETMVKLDKNKYGRTGILEMRFNGKYQRFLEIDEAHEGR